MKNILIVCLLLITNILSAQELTAIPKPLPGEIIELKIPNSGKAVLKLMFKNGSVSDPAGKEGLTALTTDMIVSSGTKDKTYTEIRKLIYPWSARLSSSTDKEVSIFTFEVPTKYLDQFYSTVVKQLFLNPSFDKNDFDRLLSNQKNYVEQVIRQSSDEEYGKKYLEYVLFQGTAYSHLIQGSVSSLSSITLDDVKNQFRSAYKKDNVTIGIAGDYPNSIVDQIKKDISQLPAGRAIVPQLILPAPPEGINVDIISKPGALGSAISAGFPMNLTRANADFPALMVANSWLGEHRKSYSRLYQKIREARSMNYGDYSYIEWYENGGSNMLPPPGTPRSMNYTSIWIRPVQTAKGLKGQYPELSDIKIGHAHFALRMALREMNQLIRNGMTKEDFESTRDFLKSYSKLYIETLSKKLGYLMDSRYYNRSNWITELDEMLSKLTVEEVNKAMIKYWQTSNMEIVIVTDESEVKALEENLKNSYLSPMSYSNNLKSSLPESIISEDNEVAAYPMKVNNVRIVNSDDTFKK